MVPKPMVGAYAPVGCDNTLSVSQLMTRYNPDNVRADKIVHIDTISGKTITYGGLRQQAAQCAWGLKHRLGLQEQAKVLAIVPNSTDFVLLAHATLWAGAVFAPLNTSSVAKDVANALTIVKPTHIAIEPSKLDVVNAALDQVSLDDRPLIFTVLKRGDNLKLFPDDISGQASAEAVGPYDLAGKSAKTTPACIVFSSGTTGKTKGVLLSHYNLTSNLIQTRTSVPSMYHSGQNEVFFPPYCHIYGLSVVVLGGMWLGSFTCGLPAFDLELFCQKMAEFKATWVHIVPPVATLLSQSDIPLKYDLSNLRTIVVAAAPMKKPLQERLKQRFGRDTKVLQGYGLSECSPTVMTQHESDEADNVGTVGKVISGCEVRLVDPVTGEDVARGEEGELWVRGPQVMMGYLGDAQATRDTFSGAWLRTGDIMRVDENDNFWITDRLKELIKYKGFQVAPSELEDLLLHHPNVIDAAVCSIYDDEQATELPIAYVSFKPEHAALPPGPKQEVLNAIRAWADGQLAGYKKLRGGVFHLQQLPKTTTGKILRRELPARVQQARRTKL